MLPEYNKVIAMKNTVEKPPIYVLAVDDEPLNQDIMGEYFEEAEINFYMINNGPDALKILEEGKPVDVIVLDRMMPMMDGIEVLKRIKANNKYKEIPVIIQTAAGASYQVTEGIKAGAFYYLIKPYSKEMLISLVNNAATLKRKSG